MVPIGELDDQFGFSICVRYTLDRDVYIRSSRHRLLCVLSTICVNEDIFFSTRLATVHVQIALLGTLSPAETTDCHSDALRLWLSRLSIIRDPTRQQKEESNTTSASRSWVVVRSRSKTRPTCSSRSARHLTSAHAKRRQSTHQHLANSVASAAGQADAMKQPRLSFDLGQHLS